MTTVPSLPNDPVAERSVLAACILDPSCIPDVAAVVDDGMFHSSNHRRVFDAVLAIVEAGGAVSHITVANRLIGGREEERTDTYNLITGICQESMALFLWRHHAAILSELAERRALIRSADYIANLAIRGDGDLAALAEDSVRSAAMRPRKSNCISLADAWVAASAESETEDRMVTTGYHDLDRLLDGGMGPGQLIILAARPSIGKSALALNIAVKAAKSGAGVYLASLEMTAQETSFRVLSSLSGVTLSDVRSARFDDPSVFNRAINTMADIPMMVGTLPSMTTAQIASEARGAIDGYDRKLVVVDYLGLITPLQKRAENRQIEVATMSRALKLLATEMDCPVLLLAQLNRAVESRANKRPQLSDLRESGAIEQDADVVMFLDRSTTPDEIKPENRTRPNEGEAVLIVAKNRHGATGDVLLSWDAPRVRFIGLARPELIQERIAV